LLATPVVPTQASTASLLCNTGPRPKCWNTAAFEQSQFIDHTGKVGWAGHIPALFEERVPMKLDKSIDPESLFTKTEIIGDVLIQYDVAEDGKKTPSEFHLLRLGAVPKPRRKRVATT
jgi:hypothetical protein